MATTADIRNGLCIEFRDDLYTIVQFQHVKPGKGPAFVRTKLKNVSSGKVIENTFSSGHKINEVRIERRPYQYLYQDEMGFNFMHAETYEKVLIETKLIDNAQFLKEGDTVEIVFHAEKEIPLLVDLAPTVNLTVTYAEPGIKGDTATNTLKPATVETGATVMVPLFINEGDRIKVDTATGAYIERAKE